MSSEKYITNIATEVNVVIEKLTKIFRISGLFGLIILLIGLFFFDQTKQTLCIGLGFIALLGSFSGIYLMKLQLLENPNSEKNIHLGD